MPEDGIEPEGSRHTSLQSDSDASSGEDEKARQEQIKTIAEEEKKAAEEQESAQVGDDKSKTGADDAEGDDEEEEDSEEEMDWNAVKEDNPLWEEKYDPRTKDVRAKASALERTIKRDVQQPAFSPPARSMDLFEAFPEEQEVLDVFELMGTEWF